MKSLGDTLSAIEVEIKEFRRRMQRLELIETPSPGAGSGDVVGPAGATDEAVARYNLATGKLIQNSVMTVTDAGTVNIPVGQTYNIAGVPVGGGGLSHPQIMSRVSIGF